MKKKKQISPLNLTRSLILFNKNASNCIEYNDFSCLPTLFLIFEQSNIKILYCFIFFKAPAFNHSNSIVFHIIFFVLL